MIRALCQGACVVAVVLAFYAATIDAPTALAFHSITSIVLAIVVGTWREVQP